MTLNGVMTAYPRYLVMYTFPTRVKIRRRLRVIAFSGQSLVDLMRP